MKSLVVIPFYRATKPGNRNTHTSNSSIHFLRFLPETPPHIVAVSGETRLAERTLSP